MNKYTIFIFTLIFIKYTYQVLEQKTPKEFPYEPEEEPQHDIERY